MPTIYSKESLDRFGDDLCEVLLSYLSFEDKFRFECLSKQWKRLVFNKQNILIIDGYLCAENTTVWQKIVKYFGFQTNNSSVLKTTDPNRVDVNRLKTILKKCPVITSIAFNNAFDRRLENRSEVFKEIIKYCVRFQSIKMDFKASNGNPEHFSVKYSPKLQSIDVCINSKVYLKALFNSLPKLQNLKQLTLDMNCATDKAFIDCLHQMSEKCLHLQKIKFLFEVKTNGLIEDIYKAMNSFTQLKRLQLNYNSVVPPLITSKALNECKHLTQLSIRGKNCLTDEFFTDIDEHLPELQSIEICETKVSDKALKSLAALPDLRSVFTLSEDSMKLISDSFVSDFIKRCPKCKGSPDHHILHAPSTHPPAHIHVFFEQWIDQV